jgi:hypothetical protein
MWRSAGSSHRGAPEYHVGMFGHSLVGFSTTTVSTMEGGAGSVAVSARPTLPVTRATSGNDARTRS